MKHLCFVLLPCLELAVSFHLSFTEEACVLSSELSQCPYGHKNNSCVSLCLRKKKESQGFGEEVKEPTTGKGSKHHRVLIETVRLECFGAAIVYCLGIPSVVVA